MQKVIGFIVTAGHLDIEWYQALRSYRFWTIEALEDLKTIDKTRDDFVTYCLDGQYYPLKEYLEVIPEDEAVMREMVRKGLLTIGPFYTQFDEWLPSAECMIRNCLYGKRKCEAFGGYMRAGYLPDNFGHPLQLPQILRGFGIDSLLFMRGMPEVEGGHPDEFLYRGLDGSELFVSHFRDSYAGAFDLFNKDVNPTQPRTVPYYDEYMSFETHRELADHDDPERVARSMIANVHRILERYPTRVVPLIAGYDHLPPQINIGDSVKMANALQDEIEFVMGDVQQYVEMAQGELNKNAPATTYDMELIGSMYQYVLLGALSTRTYIKRAHFACEALLEKYAEPLDALASLYGYPHKPKLLDEAWENLMINSAHDSIHGSSLDDVHLEMMSRYAAVRQIAAGVIHDAMKFMGKHLRAWAGANDEVLVYAPTDACCQVADVWLPVNRPLPEARGDWGAFTQAKQYERRAVSLLDEAGHVLKTQVLTREPIERNGLGQPRNAAYPGLVYDRVLIQGNFDAGRITKLRMAEVEPAESGLTGGDDFLENGLLRVETHGALIRILDKRTGVWAHNLNLLEEDADAGDAWDYAPTWTPGEVVRSTQAAFTSRLTLLGPVRGTIEVRGVLSVPRELVGDDRSFERVAMPVCFEISLDDETPRVDVRLTFQNQASDHRIRLRIPTGIQTDFIRSQGHLAILDRPIERQKEKERWIQPPTQLLPCREWVAAQDERHGLAVALKGLYDYEAVQNPLDRKPDLMITLLRGFDRMSRINTLQREGEAAMAVYTPGAQCHGEQVIEWAYCPYAVSETDKAPFLPQVQAFLYPPVAHAVRAAHEDERADGAPAPFSLTQPNLCFSAFKKCYDGDGYILRFFENQGLATVADVVLSPVFEAAYLADMNEHAIDGEAPLVLRDHHVSIRVEPYKAVTLKLTVAR